MEVERLGWQYQKTTKDIDAATREAVVKPFENLKKSFDGARENLEQLQSGLNEFGRLAKMVLLGILASAVAANEELGAEMKQIKDDFREVAVIVAKAFLPVIKDLAAIVLPILTSLANAFAGLSPGMQRFLFLLLTFVAVAPQVIGIVKGFVTLAKVIKLATYGQAAANAALGTASIPLIPLLATIAAVAIAVAVVFALLSKRTKSVTDDISKLTGSLGDISQNYGGLDGSINATSTNFASTSSTRSVDLKVDIYGHGDTPVSDDAAKTTAIKVSDIVQKELGLMFGG
jgi:archaellum component FlaC